MAKIRVAINGYGRIGRNILRAMYETKEYSDQIEIVAVNDLGDAKVNAHLTKYDTVHGRFAESVRHDESALYINDDKIMMYSQKDPSLLPWKELAVDVVYECTGFFTDKESAGLHIKAGAKKVIISAPGKGDIDATVVYGVNENVLTPDMTVISNASCTTNCLAPVAKILNDELGIDSGLMTTIHAYTNDQRLTDVYHSDLYRTRAAALNMIPTKTGAAGAVGLVVPELAGKFDGMSVRVPTANVSLVDLSFLSHRDTTVAEVNSLIEKAIENNPVLSKVIMVNHEPLVSSDFNHSSYSSNFDATQTRVQGRLVKIMTWYDNEWGFSNRMLDNTIALMNC